MKAKMWTRGVLLACLVSFCVACTQKPVVKPLPVHAAEPVVVTRTQYIPLTGWLLSEVPAAMGFGNVWGNGSMYSALAHDSRFLTTCRAQIDGIRAAYAAASATAPESPEKPAGGNGAASASEKPSL